MSPTQLTLKELRRRGYQPGIVEKNIPHTFIKQDLFGIIDIVAIGQGPILAIQCTSSTHHTDRKAKALQSPYLELWKRSGGQFEVWSWGKKGPRGKLKKWELRSERL